MQPITDDVRIREIKELTPPSHVLREFVCSERAAQVTYESRQAIHRILHDMDDRLLVIIGPCSIHDTKAAMQYAKQLMGLRERYAQDLEIVMRVYFEKPRTTIGWKGLINDPDLDGSFQINKGLRLARELLLNITEIGMPAGTEFLDMISPQYNGNEDCHVILRGGKTPNYDAASVDDACKEAANAALACRLMIDASHGNSQKKPENQIPVLRNIAAQIAEGDARIMGVMIESHLHAGRQDLVPGKPLTYGQSITDGCIGWDDSAQMLQELADAVKARRLVLETA